MRPPSGASGWKGSSLRRKPSENRRKSTGRSLSSLSAARLAAAGDDEFVLGAFIDGVLVGTAGFVRNRGARRRHKARVWGVYVTPSSGGKAWAAGCWLTL